MANDNSAKYANPARGRAALKRRISQSRPSPSRDPPRASASIPNIRGRKTHFHAAFVNSTMNYLIKGGLMSSFKLQKLLTDHHPAAAAAAAAKWFTGEPG